MDENIQKWFADPEFKKLPQDDQQLAIGEYFDTEALQQEPEFNKLAPDALSWVRNKFVQDHMDANRPPPTAMENVWGVMKRAGTEAVQGVGDIAAAGAGLSREAQRGIPIIDERLQKAAEQEAGLMGARAKMLGQPEPVPTVPPDASARRSGTMQKQAEAYGETAQALDKFTAGLPETAPPVYGEDKPFKQFVENAVTGLVRFAPTMALGFISPALNVPSTYVQYFGNSYRDKIEKGTDDKVAYDAAMMDTMIGAPMESGGSIFTIAKFKKAFGGFMKAGKLSEKAAAVFSEVILGAMGEGAEEYFQQYPQELGNIYAENSELPAKEIAKKVLDTYLTKKFQAEAGYSAAAGFTGALMLGAVGGAAGGVRGALSRGGKKEGGEAGKPGAGEAGKPVVEVAPAAPIGAAGEAHGEAAAAAPAAPVEGAAAGVAQADEGVDVAGLTNKELFEGFSPAQQQRLTVAMAQGPAAVVAEFPGNEAAIELAQRAERSRLEAAPTQKPKTDAAGMLTGRPAPPRVPPVAPAVMPAALEAPGEAIAPAGIPPATAITAVPPVAAPAAVAAPAEARPARTSSIRAFHWSKSKIDGDFDLLRLGETTAGNNPQAVESAKLGAWFTESTEPVAPGLKEANAADLTIKNPLVLTNESVPAVDVMGDKIQDAKQWLMDEVDRAGGGGKLRAELQAKGYDGIILTDSEFGNAKSFIVFDKGQIRFEKKAEGGRRKAEGEKAKTDAAATLTGKPAQPAAAENQAEKFYITEPDGNRVEARNAQRVKIVPWAKTFVHGKLGAWSISEVVTGTQIETGAPSKKAAIESAKFILENLIGEEKFKQQVEKRKEEQNAQGIRRDEGQVQEGGVERGGGQAEGGQNLEQQAQGQPGYTVGGQKEEAGAVAPAIGEPVPAAGGSVLLPPATAAPGTAAVTPPAAGTAEKPKTSAAEMLTGKKAETPAPAEARSARTSPEGGRTSPEGGAIWDNLSTGQREGIAWEVGWHTQAGRLSSVGRRVSRKNWADLESADRNLIARHIAKERADLTTKTEETKAYGPEVVVEQKGDTVEVKPDLTKKEEGALSPKEQKKYLLAEIDAAIAQAPEELPATLEITDAEVAALKAELKAAKTNEEKIAIKQREQRKDLDRLGTITVQIPGDGDFEILNAKGPLQDFKKMAKSFPVSENLGDAKLFSIPGTRPSGKRLRDFAGWYYNEFKPRSQGIVEKEQDLSPGVGTGNTEPRTRQWYRGGFFSNGDYLVKLDEKPKTRHPLETSAEKSPDMAKLAKEQSSRKGLKPAELLGELYFGEDFDKGGPEPLVHVQTPTGEHIILQARYVDSILTEHPDAKVFASEVKAAVIFKDGKEVVGLVAPMGLDIADLPEGIQGRITKKTAAASSAVATKEPEQITNPDLEKNIGAAEAPALETSPTVDGEVSSAAEIAPGAPAEKIEDFGEKIGGARKDLAERGYTMKGAAKKEETEPAWRKRFKALEKVDGSGQWAIADTRADAFVRSGQIFASQEEAEKAIPLFAVAAQFQTRQNQDGTFSINKRIGERKILKMVNQDFASREDAMKYMATHAEELLNTKTSFGEEILPVPDTVTRTGEERRTGPATKEMFVDTFAPRAIEFGNWNNQEERQLLMDHAYDGLLDLADVLGVPPKALMLNGELALAFGARGQGLVGAKAHYETDYSVINLTKMKGAGSLAHEWMHAFDHYLARLDTKANSEKVKNERGDMVYRDEAKKYQFQSHGPSYKSEMRAELKATYDNLIKGMLRKAEQYVEDTQKADKFLATARENLKYTLDGVRKEIARDMSAFHTSGYRKSLKGLTAASAEQLADFDRLSNILIEGGSLEVKYQANEAVKGGWGGRMTNDTLESLNGILKAVRNRTGFNKEGTGQIDHVRQAMQTYSQRLKMFEDAQAGTEKTKQVPTNFAIEARKMDQARAGDYWSEPHEMVARAFASYVEDKVAEKGGQSDFIVYHAHGGILLPMIDGFVARPYPEGKERTAINAAFDELAGELKTRETDRGVELYSIEPMPATAAMGDRIAAVWYSQMERTLAAKLPGSGSPQQLVNLLDSWAKSGAIKAEELEWSGLSDALKLDPSKKITKQQVLDYLRENNLRVHEKIKGGQANALEWISTERQGGYYAADESGNAWAIFKEGEQYGVYKNGQPQVFADKPVTLSAAKELAQNEIFVSSTAHGPEKAPDLNIPGGDNYRELLLTLPSTRRRLTEKEKGEQIHLGLKGNLNKQEKARLDELTRIEIAPRTDFTSSHYTEPNVLAHVRFDERTDADGKRVLFLQEVQSDWHQHGRKEGYAGLKNIPRYQAVGREGRIGRYDTAEEAQRAADEARAAGDHMAIAQELPPGGKEGVPNAPFKTSWPMLAIKRMVRWGAENGFDRIAWTTGEQQAERYDLSKKVDEIAVYRTKYPNGTLYKVIANKDGQKLIDRGGLSEKALADNIGKELAEKAVAKLATDPAPVKFAGVDLKVGGAGMKGFYDQILPAEVNKFFNKAAWGNAKVGTTEIDTTNRLADGYSGIGPDKRGVARTETVHYLPITLEMREKALTDGMPLYALQSRVPERTAVAASDFSAEDVVKWAPWLKARNTKDGIEVTTKGGRQFLIQVVDHIDVNTVVVEAYFGRPLAPGEKPRAKGAYERGRGVFRLVRDLGTNEWTLSHEAVHWMEDAGILHSEDVRALKMKIVHEAKAGRWTPTNPNDIGGKEDRANWIRQEVHRRQEHRGPLRRILDAAADLLDMFKNLFTVTARGVVRQVESGRIYERRGGPPLAIEIGHIASRLEGMREAEEEYSIPTPSQVMNDVETSRSFANRIFEQRDSGVFQVASIVRALQNKVQEMAGSRRKGPIHPFAYDKEFKRSGASDRLDMAMMLARDLAINPAKAGEFRAWAAREKGSGSLNKLQVSEIDRKLALLDAAEKLSPDQRQFVDTVGKMFDAAFTTAQANKVVQTYRDNYVRRIWRFPEGRPEAFTGAGNGHGFKVSTTAAKQRTLPTILDGWMAGYDLRVKGLTNSLSNYLEELETIIANKDFIVQGYHTRDLGGARMFDTSKRAGYARLEAPAFKMWEWAGKVGTDTAPDGSMGLLVDDHGRKFFFGQVDHVPERWAVHRKVEGQTLPRAVRVFFNKEAAAEFARGREYETEIKQRAPQDVTDLWEERPLYAPKNLAEIVNKMTRQDKLFSGTPGLDGILRFNASAKSWVLLSSFFHHMAGARSWLFAVHHGWKGRNLTDPYTGETIKSHGANVVAASRAGMRKIDERSPLIMLGVKNGLTLGSVQDWSEGMLAETKGYAEKMANRFGLEKTSRLMEAGRGARERFTTSLFGKYFAGLKAEAFTMEFVHEMQKAKEAGQNANVNQVAEQVARLINDDFGGLHHGRMGRNPTMQKIARLLLLAPDWTESNFRIVTGMVPGLNNWIGKAIGDVPQTPGMERYYRGFLARAALRIATMTILAQMLLNGWDDSRDFYKEQMGDWETFKKMRWTGVDITKIYKWLGIDTDGSRRVFSIGGHFFDPLKLVDPAKLIKGKASPMMRWGEAFFSGSDFRERPFTSVGTLLTTGKTVAKSPYDREVGGLERLPSTVWNQVINMQPVQVGYALRLLQGEEDALSALLQSAGVAVTRAWKPRETTAIREEAGGGDKVWDEVDRLTKAGVLKMEPPTKTLVIHGIPRRMTNEEYQGYSERASEIVRRRIGPAVESERWETMDDEEKARALGKVIKKARKMARQTVRREEGQKIRAERDGTGG
jgi:hypothetical protein